MEETQLAPGIFLVRRAGAPAGMVPVAAALAARQSAAAWNLCGSVEWLEAELERTTVAMAHLQRSNAELEEAAAPGGEWENDSDVLTAVRENREVIARQARRILALRNAIQLEQTEKLGPSAAARMLLQESGRGAAAAPVRDAEAPSADVDPHDGDAGVYL